MKKRMGLRESSIVLLALVVVTMGLERFSLASQPMVPSHAGGSVSLHRAPASKDTATTASAGNPILGSANEAASNSSGSGEDWKGPRSSKEFTLGAAIGYGLVEDLGGFALRVQAAKKLLNTGFIEDINNQLYLEIDVGPVFRDGTDPLLYSLHGRWDFTKDSRWTFFAIGGLGGHLVTRSGKTEVRFYPRFGAGAFFKVDELISVRAELSHELITAGATFWF